MINTMISSLGISELILFALILLLIFRLRTPQKEPVAVRTQARGPRATDKRDPFEFLIVILGALLGCAIFIF